jgi:hypothetical protein
MATFTNVRAPTTNNISPHNTATLAPYTKSSGHPSYRTCSCRVPRTGRLGCGEQKRMTQRSNSKVGR